MDEVGGKAMVDHLDRLLVNPIVEEERIELQEVEEDSSGGKLKKPQSAYFIFVAEHRKERPGVTVKDLGAIWTDMAPDERQPYIQKANELKEEYLRRLQLRAQTQNGAETGENMEARESFLELQADDDLQADPSDLLNSVFPMGRLKTIAKFDPEAAEGLKAEAWKSLQQAAYIFASDLITKSVQELMRQKKKKLMPSHLISVADQEAMYSWLLQANIWGDELGKYQKDTESSLQKKKDRFSTPQKEDARSDNKMEKAYRFKSPKNAMDEERSPISRPLADKPAMVSAKPVTQTTQLTNFFLKKT